MFLHGRLGLLGGFFAAVFMIGGCRSTTLNLAELKHGNHHSEEAGGVKMPPRLLVDNPTCYAAKVYLLTALTELISFHMQNPHKGEHSWGGSPDNKNLLTEVLSPNTAKQLIETILAKEGGDCKNSYSWPSCRIRNPYGNSGRWDEFKGFNSWLPVIYSKITLDLPSLRFFPDDLSLLPDELSKVSASNVRCRTVKIHGTNRNRSQRRGRRVCEPIAKEKQNLPESLYNPGAPRVSSSPCHPNIDGSYHGICEDQQHHIVQGRSRIKTKWGFKNAAYFDHQRLYNFMFWEVPGGELFPHNHPYAYMDKDMDLKFKHNQLYGVCMLGKYQTDRDVLDVFDFTPYLYLDNPRYGGPGSIFDEASLKEFIQQGEQYKREKGL